MNGGMRGRRRPLIVVGAVVGGLVLVFLALGTAVVIQRGGFGKYPGGVDFSALPTPGPSMCIPDREREFGELRETLTRALQKHDRAAFVGTATTTSARARMGMWWDDAEAVGFTTGAVDMPSYISDTDTISVGLHNPLDGHGYDRTTFGAKMPITVATRYRVNYQPLSGGCRYGIASWAPQTRAPWDYGRLHVVHLPHVTVAGPANGAGAVDRTAPLAERAASWLLGFLHANGVDDRTQPSGFVVFVAQNNQQVRTWFMGDEPGIKGWTTDPRNLAGRTYPLAGTVGPLGPNGQQSSGGLDPVSEAGGARVVLTPTGRHQSDFEQTAILVHEFTHNVYANLALTGEVGGSASLSAASVEGGARFVDATFRASPTSYTGHPNDVLRRALSGRMGRFDGKVPTEGQIYGSVSTANYYYDLSATTYDYLRATRGMRFAMRTMAYAHRSSTSPLGSVVVSDKNGVVRYAPGGPQLAGWRAYVHRTYG